jgi:glucokinase
MADSVLFCDFSVGSYVNMALAPAGRRPPPATRYRCPTDEDFHAALDDFLRAHGRPALMGAAVASRGWEDNGVVHLPDCDRLLSREALRERLSVRRLNLVNNFVARALAIPHLRADEFEPICGGPGVPDQNIAVLGPHYGLGVAALAPDGLGGWTAMPCEGGHSDLAATNDREWEVCRALHRRHGHVAREYALSMDGLVELWQIVTELDGGRGEDAAAQDVVDLARRGDPHAMEAVGLCTGWLAAMASDVGLITGARGGIYLTGALMDLLCDGLFDRDAFVGRYADKGGLSDYVSRIPVYRTLAKDLELIGLATLFE